MAARRLPVVEVWALGGTISMTPPDADFDAPGYDSSAPSKGVTPTFSARDIIDTLGNALPEMELRAETLAKTGSANLSFAFLLELAEQIQRTRADLFVITQGTDTLEETAYFLQQILGDSKRVVFTGAMRAALAPSADGPANLLDAIQFGLTRPPRGVYVVFDGVVHDPAFVRKNHTARLSAFESDPAPLVSLYEGREHWHGMPSTPRGSLLLKRPMPQIRLVTCTLDDDPTWLDHLLADANGLVVEAFGAGHVSEIWSDRLAELAQRLPVVLASRTGAGPVFQRTYGYKGAEIDLLERAGLVSAGRLDGRKARILLGIALTVNDGGWRDWFKARRVQ